MILIEVIVSMLFMLYGGMVWRLRGGAWNTWLHIKMGTVLTRIITGFLYALPMVLMTSNFWLLLTVTVGIWVGLMLAGWGPFMTMGTNMTPAKRTWIDVFPRMCGLKPGTVTWDLVGMMVCGVLLFVPIVISMGVISLSWWMVPVILCAAVAFAMIYLTCSRMTRLPHVPGFASGFTEWAEVGVGALVSVTFLVLLFIL